MFNIGSQPNRWSSVWCWGENHTQRRCRFTNLCYKKDTNDYVFLYDNKRSVKSGLPSDRFSPSLADMSSIADHNQYYFNYVEIASNGLAHSLSRRYRIERLMGTTFLMSRFKPDNLMHYFHDDILPLFFTLQEIGWQTIDAILLDDVYPQPMHKPFDPNKFYALFPRSLTKSELRDDTIYCMQQSFVGLSKATTFYDYGFRRPQSPIQRSEEQSLLISKTVRQLSDHLIPVDECPLNYVILISRQFNRKIVNELELIELLANYTKLSVVVVKDLDNNFESILEKMVCTRLLIGIHGSALVLSLFLRPHSALIELFPFAINPDFVTPYKTLTQLKGMNIHYYHWRNTNPNHTVTHEEYPKEWGGTQHLSAELRQQMVTNTDDVPKQLCCDEPYWLFRMYQDTLVDLNNLLPTLAKAVDDISANTTAPADECTLQPGFVMDLKCERKGGKEVETIRIQWRMPWNVALMQCSQQRLAYEVLIQELPSVSAKSWTVLQSQLSFESKTNQRHYVWIRCKLNQIYGPFNTNPVMC